MSQVLRSNLNPSEAYILAGSLASAGICAKVVGDAFCHSLGVLCSVGCSVLVPEEEYEDAECFMSASLADEIPVHEVPSEIGPSDGDPPGVGVLLYCGIWATGLLSSLASVLETAHIMILWWLRTHGSGPFPPVLRILSHLFIYCFSYLGCCILAGALGAGLLLPIIRGYRRDSPFCQLMVRAFLFCWLSVLPFFPPEL